MKNRCLNQNDPHYPNYGGSGIKLWRPWHKFINFLADMGTRPEGTTLDRIDPYDGYHPQNCRWATAKQQGEFKRKWGSVNGTRPSKERTVFNAPEEPQLDLFPKMEKIE
jgi:hypothetical protein